MTPAGDTLRRLLANESVKYTFPAASTATPKGTIDAAIAGPPSPELPGTPLPANVVMTPAAETLRIRALLASATYRLPSLLTATEVGRLKFARVADPSSPEN